MRSGQVAWPSAHLTTWHPFLSCFCSALDYLVREGRPAACPARQGVHSFRLGQEAIPPAPVPGTQAHQWF